MKIFDRKGFTPFVSIKLCRITKTTQTGKGKTRQ